MHFLCFFRFSITSYNLTSYITSHNLIIFLKKQVFKFSSLDKLPAFSSCEHSFCRSSYIDLAFLIFLIIFAFPFQASLFPSFVPPDLFFALFSRQLRQQLPIVVANSGDCIRGTCQLCMISSLERRVAEQFKESF